MTVRRLALLACGLIVLPVAPARAQTNRAVAGAGLIREAYAFSDARATGIRNLSLLTLPFAARTPFGDRFTVDLAGTFARGSLERSDGSTSTLAGLTDTRISLSAAVVPDHVSIGALVLVPTGKKRHSDAQAEVAGAIGADLLPFRISNWSTGGGLGLSGSVAHSTGTIGFGASASWVMGREFDLLSSEEFAYRPGNQLALRAVVDAAVGRSGKLAFQFTVQRASEDRVNGSNLFRPGRRFQALSTYAFRAGATGGGSVYGGLFHRSAGAYLLESGLAAAAEDLWMAGAQFRMPLRGFVLQPSADVRLLRRSDGTDQGFLLGAGASLEWSRTGGPTLIPSLRGRIGNVLVREGIETRFTGVDLGFIVRTGDGR